MIDKKYMDSSDVKRMHQYWLCVPCMCMTAIDVEQKPLQYFKAIIC